MVSACMRLTPRNRDDRFFVVNGRKRGGIRDWLVERRGCGEWVRDDCRDEEEEQGCCGCETRHVHDGKS